MSLAFVIPTRNEVDRLSVLLPQIREKYPDSKIIIIDTPTDKTPFELTKAVGLKYGAKVTDLQEGFGACLGLGLIYASYKADFIVTMDADHDLNSASLMFNALNESSNYDMAIGIENSDRPQRKAMNVLLKHMLGLTQKNPTCGLRCYRSYIIRNIISDPPDEWFFIQIELLYNAIKYNYRIIEIEFPFKIHGKATESFNSYKRFFISLIKFYFKK